MPVQGKFVSVLASLVIKARPQFVRDIAADVESLPGAEVHGDDGVGNLIVAVETSDPTQLEGVIRAIRGMQGVVMVEHVRHRRGLA